MSQATHSQEFSGFLSAVASRLRHDLKGGLITLRMGLEALSDQEELKPLLIERTQHLEGLADKLVLLLRMGQVQPRPTRLRALLSEFRAQVTQRFPQLDLQLASETGPERPTIDGDAVLLALFELVENAQLAGATELSLSTWETAAGLELQLLDNGQGLADSDSTESLSELGYSGWERPGLGLAIVRRCAQAHGGDLVMTALPERGAQAVLSLEAVPS